VAQLDEVGRFHDGVSAGQGLIALLETGGIREEAEVFASFAGLLHSREQSRLNHCAFDGK